jgi:5-methylcytosine-specific restriction endonuclease McrA
MFYRYVINPVRRYYLKLYKDGSYGKGRLYDDKDQYLGTFSTLSGAERAVCKALERKVSGNASWAQWTVQDGESDERRTVKDMILENREKIPPTKTNYRKLEQVIRSAAKLVSRTIPDKKKKVKELRKKQDNNCASCDEKLKVISNFGHFDVDHIIPFALCQREKRLVDVHHISNLQLLCLSCHRKKTNQEKRIAAENARRLKHDGDNKGDDDDDDNKTDANNESDDDDNKTIGDNESDDDDNKTIGDNEGDDDDNKTVELGIEDPNSA